MLLTVGDAAGDGWFRSWTTAEELATRNFRQPFASP